MNKSARTGGGMFVEVELEERKGSATQSECQRRCDKIFLELQNDAERAEAARAQKEPSTVHGAARWGTEQELEAAGYVQRQVDPKRLIIGRTKENQYLQVAERWTHAHALVCGRTGVGKSTGFFIPQLVERIATSMIVTEATPGYESGELYRLTSGWRKLAGHTIYCFNPSDMTSHRINPIDRVRRAPEELKANLAEKLADLIIMNGESAEARGDQTWNRSEKLLLIPLILHAAAGDPCYGHFGALRWLLLQGPDRVAKILERSPSDVAQMEFEGWMRLSGETNFKYGVFSGLITKLNPWMTDQMVTLTETTDIDLDALKKLDLKPDEAYIRQIIPVIPAIHRPIIQLPGLGNSVAPANYLYQRLGVVNESFKYPVMSFLDDAAKKDLRSDLYSAARELAGFEPVETRGKAQPIEGFISQITNSQPKAGFFLSKVISKRQDLVGRGVITAAPDLHVDELGIPEKMAWKIFHPFTMREYTKAGVGADTARKEIEQKSPRAKQMLQAAMNNRTVLMNRAPSLHKFSIMAFKPVISEGLAVRVPPLVLAGFGGDFDGDAVTIHVPTSTEAVRESYKMLPSNNLFKPGTGQLMMVPAQESTIGIYFLSHTAEGRKKINSVLPSKFHVNEVLDEKAARSLYMRIAKEDPKSYADYVLKLKALGDKEAYEKGFTAGIKDTLVDTKARDILFAKADETVARLRATHKPGAELDHKIAQTYREATDKAFDAVKPELKAQQNNFWHMVNSGARGKPSQLQQMIVSPGIVEDAKGRPVPVPIKRSYAEGVKTSDYFVASYGVRKGMLDKSLQTSEPGALNKDILASTVDNIVTKHDCGTHNGIEFPITSAEVYDRYLARDQAGYKRNTLVSPQMISDLTKRGIKTLHVRSPLKCIAHEGTCAHCYGLDEHGHLPELGDNIGAKCGQTMSEPMTQMVMKTFHTGGMAGTAPSAAGFERVKQLIHMPESYLTGEAAFSTTSGKVTKIEKTPTGQTHVFVGNTKHIVPPQRALLVKPGQTVNQGDLLSSGVMKPQNIFKFKGMEEAQNYLVDELHKTYSAQGAPMQRRVFETVARSIANLTKIVKAPKDSEFKPGEIIPYTAAMEYNQKLKETLPVVDAVGFHLNQKMGDLPQYHKLRDKDVAYLKGLGHNSIEVVKAPVVHAPILKGIERLPQEKKNWMAQFGYRYIKTSLTEGAAEAWKSAISGTHPIPAYAYGAEFGKKKEHY
ncbi:MAG: hypothetical protein EBV30_07165 [Actinobacteria bacterium]|nr:hypothetical protein [Actinomycetota bacterium]